MDDKAMQERKAMIESFCESHGWTIDEWREDEGGIVAYTGRAVVVDGDEDEGIYEGEEGDLTVSVVGSEEYRNRQIHVGFKYDDMDIPLSLRDIYAVERI